MVERQEVTDGEVTLPCSLKLMLEYANKFTLIYYTIRTFTDERINQDT